jgi:hypothetical protein
MDYFLTLEWLERRCVSITIVPENADKEPNVCLEYVADGKVNHVHGYSIQGCVEKANERYPDPSYPDDVEAGNCEGGWQL